MNYFDQPGLNLQSKAPDSEDRMLMDAGKLNVAVEYATAHAAKKPHALKHVYPMQSRSNFSSSSPTNKAAIFAVTIENKA